MSNAGSTDLTREQLRAEDARLRAEFGELFDELVALLFRFDLMELGYEDQNRDEYTPEARTILPRLPSCTSARDVQRVLQQELKRWFADGAPRFEDLDHVSDELWRWWRAGFRPR